MKKLTTLLLTVVLAIFLAACGNDSDDSEIKDTENKKEAIVDEENKESSDSKVKKKDEYVDGPLTEVGQKTKSEDGYVVELKKMITPNETINMEPIEVTIKDIKLLEMSDLNAEQVEYWQIFVEKPITDPLNYIQVSYIAENTTDENVGWSGITHLVLSNGEQIEVSTNNFVEGPDSDYEFYGKVKKDSYFGVPYQGDPEDIENIKVVIGSSFNPNDFISITKEKQVTFEFD